MTNYIFKIVIWLHYWLLHLKSNLINNYFQVYITLQVIKPKKYTTNRTHSSFINFILTEKNT